MDIVLHILSRRDVKYCQFQWNREWRIDLDSRIDLLFIGAAFTGQTCYQTRWMAEAETASTRLNEYVQIRLCKR